jgi:lipoprotein
MRNFKMAIPAAVALLLFAACSNDDIADGKKGNEKAGGKITTTFASVTAPTSRTSMTNHAFHTGGDFLWEDDDQIFVNISGTYTQSTSSELTPSKARGTFQVPGALTASSYPVTYTGKNATSGTQVTIAAVQNQKAPNNSEHFGESGDCGVATANRASDGTYTFTLQHKASYLCFMPFLSNASMFEDLRLQKIVVTSDNDIAGDYSFSAAGLGASAQSNGSRTITLNMKALAGNNLENTVFPLTNTSASVDNSAYMVIAPGQHTLKVDYYVVDPTSKVTSVTTKTVTANFKPNLVYDFTADVAPKIYHDYGTIGFYMWGTNHEFFEGRQRTAFANGDHVDFPSSSSASYSDVTTRYPVYSPSENSVNTLTANEAMHIVKNGDIHWDENIYWIADKHLWKNGAWILRKNKIPNYSQFSFEGQDYDRNGLFTPMDLPISQGKPTSNVGDYYFLPALGELVLERSMFIDRGNVIYTATKNLNPLDDNNYILLGIRNGGDAIVQNINRTTRAYPKYVFE